MASPYPGNVNIGGAIPYLIKKYGSKLYELLIDTSDPKKIDKYSEVFKQFGIQRYEMPYVMQAVLAVDPLLGARIDNVMFIGY